MPITAPGEAKLTSAEPGKSLQCNVCGFIFIGEDPPQRGYILAPFGISYRMHGAQFNTNTDADYFRNDPLLKIKVKGMVNNVIEIMNLDVESKLKGKLVPVAE